MKILACTDVHNNKLALKRIVQKAKQEKPDILICCGDISNFGTDFKEAIKPLYELNLPFLFIPGNHESVEETEIIRKFYPKLINLHKAVHKEQGYTFFGFGLGGFSIREPILEKLTSKIKKETEREKLIFITHAPIYGTKLDWLYGEHRGCISSRKFIEETKPILTLCGHFHENAGKEDKINQTRIINPGNEGKIIEI